MHTKVFQIGAAVVLLAFLSGVGSGAIAVYKPQNTQENATITSVSALGSNSVNSCSLGPVTNLYSTSIINLSEPTTNNFFQTRSNLLSILSRNFPETSILGTHSPIPITTNLAITTLSSSLIPYSTTNNNIIQSVAPFVTSISSLSLAIPTILAGLAVLGLLLSKKRMIPEDVETEDKEEEEEKDEVFNN